MSLHRNSTGELSLVLDASFLTLLIKSSMKGEDVDEDADVDKEPVEDVVFVEKPVEDADVVKKALDLDLDHPLLKQCIDEASQNGDQINALELDDSITSELASRFTIISLHRHRIRSVLPEETLQRFVNVDTLKIRGVAADAEVEEWPDWIFCLRGLKTIVDGDSVIDVGGLEEVVDDDDAQLHSTDESIGPDEDGRPVSAFYRFTLTKFKLICILRYKKGILDLSARKENPFTRGKPVKELVLCDDLDAALASKVLNMDFAFSSISSISPLPLLRLFSGVVEVNLLQTGQEVKPYWTNELTKVQGILFAINEWQRVDVGGVESTADGKFRFLLTPRIAEVMMTRLSGCLNFDDSLWHREKKIVDVKLEQDFDHKVKDQVQEIIFVGLALEEIPSWTKTFENLKWILMSDLRWQRVGEKIQDMILDVPEVSGLCFNLTPQVIHDMALFSEGFGGYIDLRKTPQNRWTNGRHFTHLRISVTSADNDDQIITNIGLLKLPLSGFHIVEGNHRFLNQIEEIWFDEDELIQSRIHNIPSWVKDLESLQWIRMGSDKWVFLLNQWIFEEMVEAGKNITLSQSSGAEWTQGRRISKILIMSDVDPSTGAEVRSINLNKNALDEFPVDLFSFFSGLRRFYAMYNCLTSLPSSPPSDLSPELDDLDLSHNSLSFIPLWLFQLPSLRHLSLSYNGVVELSGNEEKEEEEEEEENASKSTQMTDEDRGNSSTSHPSHSLHRHPKLYPSLQMSNNDCLEKLSLSHNSLTNLPTWIFSRLKSLRKLDLSFNLLTGLPDFGEGGGGEGTGRGAINEPFKPSLSLEELNLHSNQLSSIPRWICLDFPKLKKLNLSENRLTSLPLGLLTAMKEEKLKEIQIVGNEISVIDLGELREFLMAEEEGRGGLGEVGGREEDEENKPRSGSDSEAEEEEEWEREKKNPTEKVGKRRRKKKGKARKGGGGEDEQEGEEEEEILRKEEDREKNLAQGRGMKAFKKMRLDASRLESPPCQVWEEGKEAILSFIDDSIGGGVGGGKGIDCEIHR